MKDCQLMHGVALSLYTIYSDVPWCPCPIFSSPPQPQESQAPAIADGAFDGLADMAARQAADAAVKEKPEQNANSQIQEA